MRYALSFTPSASSSLWDAGSRWLGRDSYSGEFIQQPHIHGIDNDRLWELTSSARHFGLQAVIKFPFRLAPDATIERLHDLLRTFVAHQQTVMLTNLVLRSINECFFIEAQSFPTQLLHIVSDAVQMLNQVSAQLNPSEYARLKAGFLNAQEKKNLKTWGYPYVFDQFRFQIRLTSRITNTVEKEVIYSALNRYFAAVCVEPLLIDALCLYVENGPGTPLRFLHRFSFSKHSSEEEDRHHHANNTTKDFYSRYQRRAP